MEYKLCLKVGILCFLALGSARAEQSNPGLSQRYLLLATSRTSTLQDEINEAVKSGYRLVTAWSGADGGELLVLLERTEPTIQRESNVLAAIRLPTLEQELIEAATQGFHLVSRGVLLNTSLSGPDGDEIVLPLERTSGSTRQYEYMLAAVSSDYDYIPGTDKLTGTLQTQPLQRQLQQMAQRGYRVVNLVSRSTDVEMIRWLVRVRRVQYILIGEKDSENPSSSPETQSGQNDRYRIISGVGSVLQDELNRAAAAGYRLLLTTVPPPPITRKRGTKQDVPRAFAPGFPEVVLVLEKTNELFGNHNYLVMSSAGPLTLRYQMTAAARHGFRLHPGAIFSNPLSVIMERIPGEQLQRDYAVLETRRTSTMQKELLETSANGYVVVGAGLSQQDQHLVLLEKTLGTPAVEVAATSPLRLAIIGTAAVHNRQTLTMETRRSSTMEKELNEVAAEGFRILSASTPVAVGDSLIGGEVSVTLEKRAEPPATFEYLVRSTIRISTMEKELNKAAADGFRMLPGTVLLKQGTLGMIELIIIMEKSPDPEPLFEYQMLSTSRESTLEREILEAMTRGYGIAGSANCNGDHIVFLERPNLK